MNTTSTAPTLSLQVKESPAETRQVRLDIEIAWSDLASEYQRVRSEVAKDVALPGFRKGKVPTATLEKKFQGSLRAQAIEEILPKAFEQAVKDRNLKTYGQGMAKEIGDWVDEKPLTATFLVNLEPLCELKDATGVQVKVPTVEITEADIDGEVRTYLRSKMELTESAEPVGNNFWIKFDAVFAEPELAEHNLSGRSIMVENMNTAMLPVERDDVLGMKNGESKTITKTFPDNYRIGALSGKKANITVTLTTVKSVHIPEISEELAKEFKFDSIAAMRAKLRTQMEGFAARHVEREIRKQIIEALTPRAKIEIPHAMIHDVAHYFMRQHLLRMGVPEADVPHMMHSTHETIKKLHDDYMENGKKQVAEDLIMDALRVLEPAEATDEAVNTEITTRAEAMGQDAKDLRKEMLKSGEFTDLKRRLGDQAVLEKVLAKGKKLPGETIPLSKLFG